MAHEMTQRQTCGKCGREVPYRDQSLLDELQETMALKAALELSMEIERKAHNECMEYMTRRIQDYKALYQIVRASNKAMERQIEQIRHSFEESVIQELETENEYSQPAKKS